MARHHSRPLRYRLIPVCCIYIANYVVTVGFNASKCQRSTMICDTNTSQQATNLLPALLPIARTRVPASHNYIHALNCLAVATIRYNYNDPMSHGPCFQTFEILRGNHR